MAIDIQYTKVETFPDVNDNPIEPTETTAGNGSHLISQHNDLVDETESNINKLLDDAEQLRSQAGSRWITTTEVDYYAEPGNKIVFLNAFTDGNITHRLFLPNTPPVGSTVTFMIASDTLDIMNFGQFNYNNNLARLYITDAYIERTLIYIGFPYGWISTSSDNYSTVNAE